MRNTYKRKTYAKRTIRKSQIISIFGVGSLYLFKNQWSKSGDQDSLMLAGLDAWESMFNDNKAPDGWKIYEPRLQARLNKEFFLEPPDFRQYSYDDNLKNKLSKRNFSFSTQDNYSISRINRTAIYPFPWVFNKPQ